MGLNRRFAVVRQKIRSVRKVASFSGFLLTLTLGIILLCGPACSTVTTLTVTQETWVYSGTRANVELFTPAHARDEFGDLARCIAVFDFPCSLILDTALLPFTLPLQLIVGDKSRRSNEPPRKDETDPKK